VISHREYDRQYHKDIDNKRRHGAVKRELIKALLSHKKSDAETGINYEPCMAILEPAVESDEAIEKTGKKTKRAKKRAPVICQSSICVEATGGKGRP